MTEVMYRKRGGPSFTRSRSEKILRRRRVKAKIYKSRGWKLAYHEYFVEIEEYPYIVRK